MKAIILAAGRGSRMNELTNERPKCLVELNGKTLLEWQLLALHDAGITEIAIVTGYKREMLENRGLLEFHNSRWAETQMVSSLVCATDWLETGPCIVSYSDIFYSSKAVQLLMACQADLAVTYDPNWLEIWEKRFSDPLVDAETFRLSADNILEEIGKTPETLEEVQGQYMGLLKFTPEGWAETLRIRSDLKPEELDKMHMTETLQMVIEVGCVNITAVPYFDKWGEVDSEVDLQAYKDDGY